MELSKIHVGFPIIKIDVRIHYSTPRSPNAFERVTLAICEKFSANETYSNLLLSRVFIDFLGVADPILILRKTIQDLTSLGVLKNNGDVESVERIYLKDLEITQRGRIMLADNVLPAQSQVRDELFYFDPVSNRLVNFDIAKDYQPSIAASCIDAEVFSEVIPEEEIRNTINDGNNQWYQSNCKIELIEKLNSSVLWRDFVGAVTIERGEVKVVLEDPTLSSYINNLSPEEVFRKFIKPNFAQNEFANSELPELSLSTLELNGDSPTRITSLVNLNENFAKNENLWMLNGEYSLVTVPEFVEKKRIFFKFGKFADLPHLSVSWNSTHDGCILFLKEKFPFENSIISSASQVASLRLASFRIRNESYKLPMIVMTSSLSEVEKISKTLADIARKLTHHGNEDSAIVPALWQSEQEFWGNFSNSLVNRSVPFGEKIGRLKVIKNHYSKMMGDMQAQTWSNLITELVYQYFGVGSTSLSLEEFSNIFAILHDCELSSTSSAMEITADLLRAVDLPATLEEFQKISQAINDGGSIWTLPFPSPAYTPTILSLLFNEFPKPLVIDFLININEFDLGVIELVNDYKELISVFGDVLEDVHDVSTSKISLSPINSIHAIDIGTSWLRKYESFLSTFPDVVNCAKESAMDKLSKKVGVLVEAYRKNSSATGTSFTCTFVLDTSALIDSPDLLKFIKPEELVVVSKRVIDELDDKKRDENLRPSIAKATRGLQEFPSSQMHFCDGDMSVLSADYRMKGDNLILSVAVKYRQHNPILITNDKNLTLKARAEGITAISVGEFRLGRRV